MLLDYYKTISNKTPQIGNFGEYRTFVRHGGLPKEFAVLTRGQSKHNSLEGDETFNVPFLKRIQLKRAGKILTGNFLLINEPYVFVMLRRHFLGL